ncbi:MAG TPA: hypothetical protein EYN32_06125 [Phycisphaerales bacterium]|nr:hypothetical protein [Phycisphaerales bacterium]
MVSAMLSDATPVFLISPWKPMLIMLVFLAWGWLVSTHLEKDARSARINPMMWNGIYISSAIVGLGAMLFGVNFYLAYPVGVAVLFAPILIYWKVRNNAVSEEFQFHLGVDTIRAALATRKRAKSDRQVSMQFKGKAGSVEVPQKEDPQLDIYLTVDELLSDAILNRASRLEFQLTSKGCQSMYITDGIPTKQEPITAETGAKVLAFLKETAGADPTDVRRRQTGEFDVSTNEGDSHVNLTASGSSSSHSVRLEFDRSQRVLRTWESLGMLPKQRELLDQLKQENRRHGIVLIGGSTQSGITTTGYSILSQHDSYLSNIVTLEHEILATLEGITHNNVTDNAGDYTSQLQTIIRRDPEVILFADLVEPSAAKIAVKPGKEGPLIFITMPATSMTELISKWASFVANPRQSFDALQAVVFQKLVRKLCENCRVAYKPSEDLAKQGLPLSTVEQLYRKGGQVEQKNKLIICPICKGSGYLGQVGVFETMFLDSETRKHLIAGDLKAAIACARRNKCFIRLQEAAWQKVASGETSLEEFGRVNMKPSKKKKVASSK